MDIKDYWNDKIIEWEDSMRGTGPVSFVEKLGSYFRKPVIWRNQTALEIIRPHVQGKTVLDLGCGSGFFALELLRTSQVKKVIGIDISANAIVRANRLIQENNLSGRCEFYNQAVDPQALPSSDITVGLGFLDYLTAPEITDLFRGLKSPYFLFSLTERKFSILRYIHIMYLWSQKCPQHFYYTQNEFLNFVGGRYGQINFFEDKRLTFASLVHNLPPT